MFSQDLRGRNRSIAKIIEEDSLLPGIKPMALARNLVAHARKQAAMDDAQARHLA